MNTLFLTILFLFTCVTTFAQSDNCVRQECFGDSITQTYFCSKFDYNVNEFWEVRYFSGFNYKDSFHLADVEFATIYEIEKNLPKQLFKINEDKIGQRGCLNIELNLKKYHRQYFCYIDRNGDKIILINFLYFHNKTEVPDLKRPSFYTDGCSRFWKIKYNVKTKAFFDLRVNGRA